MPLISVMNSLTQTLPRVRLVVRKICVRDLYTKAESGPLDATLPLTAVAAPHDSVFLCVRPAVGGGCASHGGCPAYPA